MIKFDKKSLFIDYKFLYNKIYNKVRNKTVEPFVINKVKKVLEKKIISNINKIKNSKIKNR